MMSHLGIILVNAFLSHCKQKSIAHMAYIADVVYYKIILFKSPNLREILIVY